MPEQALLAGRRAPPLRAISSREQSVVPPPMYNRTSTRFLHRRGRFEIDIRRPPVQTERPHRWKPARAMRAARAQGSPRLGRSPRRRRRALGIGRPITAWSITGSWLSACSLMEHRWRRQVFKQGHLLRLQPAGAERIWAINEVNLLRIFNILLARRRPTARCCAPRWSSSTNGCNGPTQQRLVYVRGDIDDGDKPLADRFRASAQMRD